MQTHYGSASGRRSSSTPRPSGSPLFQTQHKPVSTGVNELLQLNNNLQALRAGVSARSAEPAVTPSRRRPCRKPEDKCAAEMKWAVTLEPRDRAPLREIAPEPTIPPKPDEVDALYLFACYLQWERQEDPSAAWELIAAAQCNSSDTRAHARALLSSSRHIGSIGVKPEHVSPRKRQPKEEDQMKTPYGLNIVEECSECSDFCPGHFCNLSQEVLEAISRVSHKSIIPPGGILYVEGQTPRGMFIVCSGRVNLSTTSKEGKILILRAAEAGETLGLSATISGQTYETTAETATPCVLNFIERKHFLELMQLHSEFGIQAAQCLSREYRSAYHDIHDLVLTRSSTGKLIRLLLSQAAPEGDDPASCRPTPMTHEEMAMRIGASRETVTRLLSVLRRKRLIRIDGPTLVIRNRTALEALAV